MVYIALHGGTRVAKLLDTYPVETNQTHSVGHGIAVFCMLLGCYAS